MKIVERGTGRGDARRSSFVVALMAGCSLGAIFVADQAVAQDLPAGFTAAPQDAQLFLEADTVTYDSDRSLVTASGGVQIDYGDNKLVAREITYDQNTRRLIATGDVELVQPDGNRIYADRIDVTDDFRDGFVQALRIETPQNTRFAATDAVRQDGAVTTFNRGVYTACEPCRENPDRAPLWQVKARKIVWDQTEKEIRYYGAQFELFGAPLAYLPYFQSPDPTVKRKSGFLPPSFVASDELGYGLRVPYFFAISDDKDLTVAGTYYSKQGFLGEVEYRQAFQDGFITLKTAGIVQQDPDAFADDNIYAADGESPDFANTERGMIGTKGAFALSENWTFGWDVLWQSDANFSNTYDIEGFDDTLRTSEIYLTGLGEQSFFDLRAQKFDYQTIDDTYEDQQPLVAPSLDYRRIEQEPFAGGEIEANFNVTSLYRDDDQTSGICLTSMSTSQNSETCLAPGVEYQFNQDLTRYTALEGDYTRGSADIAWRDSYVTPQGLILSPTLGLRGDLYTANMSSDGFQNLRIYKDGTGFIFDQGALELNEDGARGMATAALEARYPYLVSVGGVSHIIEPIAQIIVRPDETQIGYVPNEDASTLVFNASNLFSLDKFAGYDRIEGGTRANVGARYQAITDTGYTLTAIAGQSYHLGGKNSFAQTDLSLVGYDSGLETDRSDYVGSLTLGTPIGFSIGTGARFDEETFEVRRTDVFASYSNSYASAAVTFSDIAPQPIYGSMDDRTQVTAAGTLQFAENWNAFGSFGFDIENDELYSRSFGVGYADECFSLLVSYTQEQRTYTDEANEETLMFQIGLRTISNFNQSVDLGGS